MAVKKAHEVDQYLKSPDPKHKTILLYGQDRGLVSERATTLAASLKIDLDDPFSTIRLDADDAAADKNRIADEAHTVSMFGGDRLIWIRGSTQKNLAIALQPVLDVPPVDTTVLLEAGDLKKSAPLRTRIEKSPNSIALPCYQDQGRALDTIIDQECKSAGLTIAPDTRSMLKSLLGGDRIASRGEVQKLCLYAAKKGMISADDVGTIVGDASGLDMDAAFDAALLGQTAQVEERVNRLLARGTTPVQLHMMMHRQLQALHAMRIVMEANRTAAASVVGAMRPPVNFQRRDAVVRILSGWSTDGLAKCVDRFGKIALDIRAQQAIAADLLTMAFLAVSLEARRMMRT
ncbi:MAG: DNA polymerase III subunit delta [Pseudomonadota bacterium]